MGKAIEPERMVPGDAREGESGGALKSARYTRPASCRHRSGSFLAKPRCTPVGRARGRVLSRATL
jgi:hypothetical protein